jgi:fumarate reductase flavoprotein subunit
MAYDLVSIGGGFSGLVTACRAAELGLRAVVLEARSEQRYPCSSRWSTGVFGVMGLSLASPPDKLRATILEGTDGFAKPALAEAIAANARRAHDWLLAQGAAFDPPPFPPGTRDRSAHVLAPMRRFGAGLDWERRGADRLMQVLEGNLGRKGGAVLRGTKAEAILVEGGACVGVEVSERGARQTLRASAVAIADGGFAANPELVRRWITPRPERVFARVGPGAMGDGILMAEAAGAAIGGFGAFYGHIHHRDAMENAKLWPYPHFDALAVSGGVIVGPDGKRFFADGLDGVAIANQIARLADPLSAVILFDEAMWQGAPGRAAPVGCNPHLQEAGGWLWSAPDIAALAAKAGLPEAALAATAAASRLGAPPYHAAPLAVGVTGTMGGVEIDADARALRPDGAPLAGLYAVGTPVAHLEGGPRAGYVGGLCKAFVLGLLAAEHAARGRAGEA